MSFRTRSWRRVGSGNGSFRVPWSAIVLSAYSNIIESYSPFRASGDVLDFVSPLFAVTSYLFRSYHYGKMAGWSFRQC
ncbi:MAG: hypothetical protein Q4G68_10995 [Planctomycetia bacterium]|nr:hypothetical protein [Planctomycetia bacterium]